MYNFQTWRQQLSEIKLTSARSLISKFEEPPKVEPLKRKALQFVPVAGFRLPDPSEGEEDFQMDQINYMLNNQMPLINVSFCFDDDRRTTLINYAFSVFSFKTRPLETYFLAVHILDHTFKVHAKKIKRLSEEEIAPIIIAAIEIGSKCEALYGIIHHFQEAYPAAVIRTWEREHLRVFDFNTSRTHVLHFLRIFQCMTINLISSQHLELVWSTIKGLACIAVAKSSLVDRLPSLLAASIMRIALELFAHRCHLRSEINMGAIEHLQHKETDHIPVALELLYWLQTRPKTISSITTYFSEKGVMVKGSEIEAIINQLEMRKTACETESMQSEN